MEKSMTQEKNTKQSVKNVGANVVDPAQTGHVRFRQMTNNDIFKLPTYKANVLKNKSKRGNVFYQLTVQLHRMLIISINLSATEYFLITQLRKLDETKPINTIDIWARFIKGPKDDGSNWQRWEFFICKDVYFGALFEDQENTLMEVASIKLPFIETKTELENVDAYDEEAQEQLKKRMESIF